LPILDFGLRDKKDKNMHKTFESRHSDSPSDNRKSKIKNPKFVLVGAMLFALSFSAAAQQPAKIPRIGYLSPSGDPYTPGTHVEAFRQGLRDLAYIEGKNIRVGGKAVRNTVRSALLVAGILLFTVYADEQQPGKIFRIGFLDNSTASGTRPSAKPIH
jgi:hypothetical protein